MTNANPLPCNNQSCRRQTAEFLQGYFERYVYAVLSIIACLISFAILVHLVLEDEVGLKELGAFFGSGGVGAILLSRTLRIYEDARDIMTGRIEISCSRSNE